MPDKPRLLRTTLRGRAYSKNASQRGSPSDIPQRPYPLIYQSLLSPHISLNTWIDDLSTLAVSSHLTQMPARTPEVKYKLTYGSSSWNSGWIMPSSTGMNYSRLQEHLLMVCTEINFEKMSLSNNTTATSTLLT